MDEQTQTLDDKITAAVREGYSMKEIADHLASSENPEHKAWAQRYTGVAAPQEAASAPESSVKAPLTQFVTENPVEAAGAAALAYGALKAPGLYSAAQDRKVAQRKLDIEERRLGAYEEQVARQGMGGQAAQPVVQEAPKLSPLEEARVETERVRAEHLKQKMALAEAKAAREEAAAKAREAAGAVKKQQTSGGTITESEAKMLAASEEAKITKAVIADQKAKASKAVAPAVVQQGAVVPPAQPSPTVQLTPSPQVSAEGVPESSFAGAQELKTGTGKPAFQGMNPEGKLHKSYSSIKDVPANMAFVPGAQYVDVLRNDLSQPTYTEQFRTKDWPSVYEQAIEEAKGINRSLGRETRAALLAKGVPKEELPKPTEGIFQKIGGKHGSKAVRVGGVVGALTTIPNLVNAQTLGEAADIISDVAVPPFAQSREAGMPKSEEEKLLASKFKEAAKLGSPYRSVPPPTR